MPVHARRNLAAYRPCRAGWAAGLAVLLVLLSACASPGFQTGASADADAGSCSDWLRRLDTVVDEAGVRDGRAHRVPGYRFLRADRFLASFGNEAADKPALFEAWVARLAQLDAESRAIELRNLPLSHVLRLDVADKAAAGARTHQCAQDAQRTLIAPGDASAATVRRALAVRLQVPDDYSDVKRALGLYPLARIPFFAGVKGWQDGTAATFASPAASHAAAGARMLHYAPAGEPVSAEQLAAAYARRNPDALGIPRLNPGDEALLLRAYAPDVHVDTQAGYDRIGALQWANDPRAAEAPDGHTPSPAVLTDRPVMYQRAAYTRHQNQTLLQLVYSVWFPERPLTTAVDLLGGKLDGVVLRVTLAPDGTPWLYDSIHACGCYHLFFPTPRASALPPPDVEGRIEWAFVPATLPTLAVGQRMAIYLASQTHYVEALKPAPAGSPAKGLPIPYELVHDNALRSLPVAGAAPGTTRSAFWPNGIVPGTERGERVLFWPMGIDSPGAMRQWGRQPTAFVGRRHFDDARLMEQRFELVP
jgi:hypothetical protein